MTKKSYARQMRDAKEREIKDARAEVAVQIEGNTVYDDIHQMYGTCGQLLAGYAASFNQLEVGKAVPLLDEEQKVKVGTLVSGFQTDIHQLQSDLIAIRAPFKDKSGGETNVDTFIETIGVVEQFQEFVGRTKGVLDPVFRSLSAEVATTRQLMPEQDPAVVTDVQEKTAQHVAA
jgi:hypothetical protein